MSEPVLFNPETDVHLVPQFVRILIDCIEQEPYLSAAFLKPLDPVAIEKWFHSLVQAIAKGGRKLFVQSAPNPSTGEEEVAGIVMLILPVSETGPFRAYIDKLLVAPEHRRQGVARRLMNALEATAKEMGRTLLVGLDFVFGRHSILAG
jgi:ribosomal protein S18 acetylase RimI-like enzyme